MDDLEENNELNLYLETFYPIALNNEVNKPER